MSQNSPYLQSLLEARNGEIVVVPPKLAAFAPIPAGIHWHLKDALSGQRLHRLYTHQAQSFELATSGRDVLVTTGTASGKSLCYNLPVLQSCLTEPVARALYIFPSKALAQDQAIKLEELIGGDWATAGVYDGDTKKSHRSAIREEAHIILTNPDMLHIGMLPQHELWGKFLKNLQYIVIDEAHVYRGVFGSHVSGIVRRLIRLAAWRRARPQVIMTSATLSDPAEFFTKLTGRTASIVTEDGAAQGGKIYLTVPAPEVEDHQSSRPNQECARLLAESVDGGRKSLAFCRARSSAELVTRYARESLVAASRSPKLVETYRAGYTPKIRRKIESDFQAGRLQGLASTNALELGVDIGGLDTVILNGYPGTLSSFRQQSGRAGRSGDDGTVILIAHEDPLEQYIAKSPREALFGRLETIHLKPEQPWALRDQLRCAAYERPLDSAELAIWGDFAEPAALLMVDQGDLVFAAGRYTYPSHTNPAPQISLRGGGGRRFNLVCGDELLGECEEWRAKSDLHPGAIYMHRGETYEAQEWEMDAKFIPLLQVETDYYTQSVQQSAIEAKTKLGETDLSPGIFELWSLECTTVTSAYRRIAFEGQAFMGESPLALPPDTLDTIGIRLVCPEGVLDLDDVSSFSAWHGVEHALMAVAPLLGCCDRKDLGSSWYIVCADNLLPGIYIHDKYPGGVGIAESLMKQAPAWLAAALDLLLRCPCRDGCPLCLFSPRCESRNEMLSKMGAIRLLRIFTGQGGLSSSTVS